MHFMALPNKRFDNSKYDGKFGRSPNTDGEAQGSPFAGRIPPHSMEAEESVLGGILLDNETINSAIELVREPSMRGLLTLELSGPINREAIDRPA